MKALIIVYPVLLLKFFRVDVVLKPKEFCPRRGMKSWPRAQHSDVQSQVLYHSATQSLQNQKYLEDTIKAQT